MASKNAFIYLSSTLSVSAIGLLISFGMTHFLLPIEYGRIGVALSVIYLTVPLVSVGAEGLVAVNSITLKNDQYKIFKQTLLTLGCIICVILVLSLSALYFTGLILEKFIILLPVYSLLRFVNQACLVEKISKSDPLGYALNVFANSIISSLITLILLNYLAPKAESRLAALGLSEICLIVGRYAKRRAFEFEFSLDREMAKQIRDFGLPSLFSLFGAWGLNEADKLLVATYSTLEVAGIYTAAVSIASIIVIFNQSLTNSIYPRMYEDISRGHQSFASILTRYTYTYLISNIVLAAVMAGLYALLSESILPIKYAAGSEFVYLLLGSNISISIYRPIGLAADYFKMARAKAVAVNIGGMLTIIVSYIGLKEFNSPKVVILSAACGYCISALLLRRNLLLHLPSNEKFND